MVAACAREGEGVGDVLTSNTAAGVQPLAPLPFRVFHTPTPTRTTGDCLAVTPRWRVGTVQPLGDDDDSPFLGQLPPGSSSLAVESGLFRALAHPYEPPSSDFLLLRSPVRAEGWGPGLGWQRWRWRNTV